MKIVMIAGALAGVVSPAASAETFRFRGAGDAAPYSAAAGHGIETGGTAETGGAGGTPTVRAGAVQSDTPFFFSADVPAEGNYRVTLVLGGPVASRTTVKAELRRLMLDGQAVAAGGSVTRSFIVNTRRPQIAGGGEVRLKAPRESIQEAVAWDRRLTLEFNGDHPAVRSIAIVPVTVPTIYLLGDSTVTDQSGEPYASWGQMLPILFGPGVAIANHGESGESVASGNERGRFAKILSLIRPGDMFVVQFGHNDQKELATDPQAALKYKAGLIAWVKAVQGKGATAVIVTPMNRHSFEGGRVINTLDSYPDMARAAARESGAALVDLNAMSKTLYEALGEVPSLALFKHEGDGSKRDATHHSPYGAYELAKLVALGLRQAHVPLAARLRPGFAFDPARPDAEAAVRIPPSPTYTSQRPLGD